MSVWGRISRSLGVSEAPDLNQLMSEVEEEQIDILHQAADFYVKPISLNGASDVQLVKDELANNNIVLLNVSSILRNPDKLHELIGEIKSYAIQNKGDLAKIDGDKVLVTPSKVKIERKKQ